VISLGGVVVHKSVRMAGNKIDEDKGRGFILKTASLTR